MPDSAATEMSQPTQQLVSSVQDKKGGRQPFPYFRCPVVVSGKPELSLERGMNEPGSSQEQQRFSNLLCLKNPSPGELVKDADEWPHL